jgi:hypothetical protein
VAAAGDGLWARDIAVMPKVATRMGSVIFMMSFLIEV